MKIVQNISAWLQHFWNKTRDHKKVRIVEKLLWFLLFFLETLYCLFFYVINRFKLLRKPYRAPWPVISVGNISLGGTGKSVFVQFLMTICPGNPAVLLRGYGGTTKGSLMVSDGRTVFVDVVTSGDEAFMLAQALKGPVVIGKDRAASCKLLEQHLKQSHENIVAIILDDAYQHHSLYKNLEILLLDARYPFENGHCVPAGRLREKDITRADVIVLTHADQVNLRALQVIKNDLKKTVRANVPVFTGNHHVSGLFFENYERVAGSTLQAPFFICAGIGSWNGFVASVKQVGVVVGAQARFEDHHNYSLDDIAAIIKSMRDFGLQQVITTEKDWVKIKPLLSSNQLHDKVSWYILRVEFAFLSQEELSFFMALVNGAGL